MNFSVESKFEISVMKTIEAESMEDALEKAKTLRVPDFVSFNGDWMDGDNIEIITVMKEIK